MASHVYSESVGVKLSKQIDFKIHSCENISDLFDLVITFSTYLWVSSASGTGEEVPLGDSVLRATARVDSRKAEEVLFRFKFKLGHLN